MPPCAPQTLPSSAFGGGAGEATVRILLDTNAVSALMRGDASLAASVRNATELVFSTVVVGELVHGYRAGKRHEKNMAVLRRFLAQSFVELREVGFETALGFGRIQSELHARGTPIPTNDVWIAAHAAETGAELWTFDDHFKVVTGLQWRHLL